MPPLSRALHSLPEGNSHFPNLFPYISHVFVGATFMALNWRHIFTLSREVVKNITHCIDGGHLNKLAGRARKVNLKSQDYQ